jgi:hypothetical protein
MARRKRSKGEKPEAQQLAISFQGKKAPEAQPDVLRVFPLELRPGDRVKDGEWEVAALPTSYQKGKMVTVRLQKPGDSSVTDVEHWPAHERVAVRREQR